MQVTTQRRLILIRHAKAVEEDVGGDHARGLSARGRQAATALGAWLKAQQEVPALVLCSTAMRTRQTLELLALGNVPVILSDKLYLASSSDLLMQLQGQDDAVQNVAVIGHNPGIHALLGALIGAYDHEADADRVLEKFPTCACAILRGDLMHWRDAKPARFTLEALRA